MMRDGPAGKLRGVDILATFVVLPGGGRIEYTTASAVSREGNRPVFAVFDQTESWTESNGGKRLAAAVRRNLGKTGGCSVESPNAWRPGWGSVAEASGEYHRMIEAGRATDDGLLWDHREAPADTDLRDPESLRYGLRSRTATRPTIRAAVCSTTRRVRPAGLDWTAPNARSPTSTPTPPTPASTS